MRAATTILSGLMVVLGVTMISIALARGGGPAAFGVVMGVLFAAAGVLRLWAEHR
jgi:hypothetical protein